MMDPTEDISFLKKPNINPEKLTYIGTKIKVYANLYEIILKKPLKLFQYPYLVTPKIEPGDIKIRQRLFRGCSKILKETYGECFISGDSLFGIKKYEKGNSITYSFGQTEYRLDLQKNVNEKVIKQEDIHKDRLAKQFIEMLIKDILHANPKLEFYKDLFVLTNKKNKRDLNKLLNFIPYQIGCTKASCLIS